MLGKRGVTGGVVRITGKSRGSVGPLFVLGGRVWWFGGAEVEGF
jgi:hypothetical protein